VGNNAQKRPTILAQWSRAPVPADLSVISGPRRDRRVNAVVYAMQRPLPPRALRRRANRGIAAAAAVAALFLLALGTVMARNGGGSPGHRLSVALAPAHPQAPGREPAATPSPEADARSHVDPGLEVLPSMRLSSGATISASPDTLATVTYPGDPSNPREEVALELGLVRVEVPKLPDGRTFSVRTPDSVVTVHGTAFSVEVIKSGPSTVPVTRVRVTHGIVGVLHAGREALLYAGADWMSSAETAPVVSTPASSPLLKHRTDRTPAGAGRAASPADPAAERAASNETELANQNRLFAEAMDAREQGDPARAARLFEDFVRRYPVCPLTQDAYVERFRTLVQLGDRPGASRAARAYLTLYRSGFARDEARALALDSDR
jgi:hypothetical protein